MHQVQYIEGAFGAGKSYLLVQRAIDALKDRQRVLLIAPTLNHQRDLQNTLARQLKQDPDQFPTLVWRTAPEMALGSPETAIALVNSMDVVMIDDADYPIGYKWRMRDVVKMVYSTRRPLLVLTCRDVACLCRGLSLTPDNVTTLNKSLRLENVKHAHFMRALFTPKSCQVQRLTLAQLPVLLPCTTVAEMSLAALNSVHALYTVVLCDDESVLQHIFGSAPGWNDNRKRHGQRVIPVMRLPTNTNHYFDPCSLQLSTIANFYGRERRHVVAVFPSSKIATNMLVEALTRHAVSLTIIFLAADPPAPLHNVLWMTDTATDNDVFIDSSHKRAKCDDSDENNIITALAKQVVDDTRDLEAALNLLQTFITQPFNVTLTFFHIPDYKPYAGPPLPDNIDRALGTVVEAVILQALQAQRLEQSEVYRKTLSALPAKEYSSIDEQLWHMAVVAAHQAGQTDVQLSDDFYEWNRQHNYEYFHDIDKSINTHAPFGCSAQIKAQVPLTFTSAQGTPYRGIADAVGFVNEKVDFILEIKHMRKQTRVTDAAIVQALLYALAAKTSQAFVFNAASGYVAQLAITYA